jgi:pimeloyl-ACP methyl ester carboxylesterase
LLAFTLLTATTPTPSPDRLWANLSVPPGATSGRLALTPCLYHSRFDGRDFAADCGTLVVPENRHRPGRLIALPVVRIRATGGRSAEAIFTFKGGPGASNAISFPIAGQLARHDVVVVGYRGADGSEILDCPEVSERIAAVDGPILGLPALSGYAAGARACAARLRRQGVDLDGYSMSQTVDDQEDARKALNYGPIDLLGGSYGTRLEMIYMWRYPGSLRRVIMIGVNPPGGFVWNPQATDGIIAQYAALCAPDPACRGRTSDLQQTMRGVSAHMPASWMGVPIEPDRVRLMSFFGLHETVAPKGSAPLTGPAVIDAWLSASEGDAGGLALLSVLSHALGPHLISNWGHFLAMGASADDYLRLSDQDVRQLAPADAIIGAPGSRLFAAMARGWPPNPDHGDYSSALPSNVETLLIEGTLDATTPLAPPRDRLLPQLSRGHLVALREFGHTATFWNSQPNARERLLDAFFDEGRVDSSLYVDQPPVFKVENGFSALAREAVAVSGLAVLAIAGLACFTLRAVQRRLKPPTAATPGRPRRSTRARPSSGKAW